ncbi:D-alanyl-D-alanine carboxypeptidase [Kamptonema sp. UHCC 0994]|uniref:D-alanyl-D-alanine carboxypeptidase n=1 Tax=Kamptonema sp. UHCC 0994 TaxID=3031329 RepID=UPI0023BA299D|nr:D-alanyl-D-alanine carboxypeptidase [Kamptonema sp. UHCC 0994]MDF0554715.1 D-alanyl-D-alanine carboxypeptidase [Kamptonema sp. UHCC 0994]
MLELLSSGVISLWLEAAGLQKAGLNAAAVLGWEGGLSGLVLAGGDVGQSPLVNPDAVTTAAVQGYLRQLSAKGMLEGTQGVWMQSGIMPLVSNEGTVPVPGASLTKIATSLASLQTWGPNFQFETRVSATGPIKNGVLQGDLVVEGGGDPLFVWEEAIAVGNALNKMGISRVAGNLVIVGKFWMNYELNPMVVGELLREGLDSTIWSPGVQALYFKMPPGTARPRVAIAGNVVAKKSVASGRLLLKRRSLPLAEILKQMNIYSDNEMAEMLADAVGGAKVVQQQAAWAAGVPQSEVQLINGSGLGEENRISPRAICAMLQAIQRYLYGTNLTIADLFPVSGRDKGTLERRHIPLGTVAKTGTLDRVIALAGVIPTRDRGLVWFAIVNRGSDWDGLRSEQDLFLQQLVRKWGIAPNLPFAITPHINGARPALGAANRNDILIGG